MIAALALVAIASGISGCVVYGHSTYAPPLNAPIATMTVFVSQDDYMQMSQQSIYVSGDERMKDAGIFSLINGASSGVDSLGSQLHNQPTSVEAGRRLYFFSSTRRPSYPSFQYCQGKVSFVPLNDHAYIIQHDIVGAECRLVVIDQETRSPPPDFQTHAPTNDGNIW
ncbi:hypothetical protein [Brevundimonas sp.]|uniref:hypothetical protein n=1 Tax=Brevundimonas sp. TaxID=1871086 RepID=UPI003AF7ADC4